MAMLEEYGRKRDFNITPEPRGQVNNASSKPLTFVVQKHDARRLHYDFRLEIDGVLVSWAVPKGPSYDPKEKRLAVQTEDHPIDYAHFEGIIPERQYGAGPVIVWDHGTFSPDEGGELSWEDRDHAQQRMREGLKKGKLSFFLRGEKLQGSWTLVRLGGKNSTKKEWLLIKHQDEFADSALDIVEQNDRSVVTGRTVEEVEAGKEAKNPVVQPDKIAGARKESRFPKDYSPQLATLIDEPFNESEWIFEPKMDGIRAVVMIHKGKVQLFSRRGLELTGAYPELVAELRAHVDTDLILDGEVVALDEQGRPSFQLLQQRSGLSRTDDVKKAVTGNPAHLYIFDIMRVGNINVEGAILRDRKALLRQIIKPSPHVKLMEYFAEDGITAHQAFVEFGLEGTMAKRVDSIYAKGKRTRTWLKIKATQSAEFLILGYTKGTGTRDDTFGALLVGYHDVQGQIKFAGSVGTGFNDKLLRQLLTSMKPLQVDKAPYKGKRPPASKQAIWLKPNLVAEIKFAEWTRDGMLRSPVFMRLRDDINPRDVKRTRAVETEEAVEAAVTETESETKTTAGAKNRSASHLRVVPSEPKPIKAESRSRTRKQHQMNQDVIDQLTDSKSEKLIVEVDGHSISFSSLNKIFWTETENSPAITKRDYAIYLTKVAPYLLTHTTDRPLTLLRYPNGIAGGKFYQKHIEHGLPAFVNPVMLWSEQYQLDHEYITINNLPTLLWLAQMADLELHTWMSRINPKPDGAALSRTFTGSEDQLESSLLNYPDYLILDLDPYIYSGKENKGDEPELNLDAFKKCCEVALWLKEILDQLKIKSFVKTTGKTGLHIYIPIVRQFDFDQVRTIAEVIGKALHQQHSDDVTMQWQVKNRTGKIFYDHNMNSRGKTLASIYSARVAPGAPVSVPVHWTEIENGKVYPTDYKMHTVPEFLAKRGDLWEDILNHKNDLEALMGIKPRDPSEKPARVKRTTPRWSKKKKP